jgi:hypothetical protein
MDATQFAATIRRFGSPEPLVRITIMSLLSNFQRPLRQLHPLLVAAAFCGVTAVLYAAIHVTPEEHAMHAKAFDHYIPGGENIRARAALEQGQPGETIAYIGIPTVDLVGGMERPGEDAVSALFRLKSCTTALVTVARLEDKQSDFTEDGSTVFTEYEMVPGQVLKQDLSSPQFPARSIIVLRPGGPTTLNGRPVRVTEVGTQSFAYGRDYLLFLSRGPTNRSCISHIRSAYLVTDDKLNVLTGGPELEALSMTTVAGIVQSNAGQCASVVDGALDK